MAALDISQPDPEPKTVRIDFGSMLQSKEGQAGILKDIAQSKSPDLGKAIPKEK